MHLFCLFSLPLFLFSVCFQLKTENTAFCVCSWSFPDLLGTRSPPAPRPRLPRPWFPSDPPTISPSRQLFLAASPLLTKLIREMWLAGQVFLSSSGWQAPLSKDKIFPSRVSLLLPQDRQSHPSQSFHTLLALRMF